MLVMTMNFVETITAAETTTDEMTGDIGIIQGGMVVGTMTMTGVAVDTIEIVTASAVDVTILVAGVMDMAEGGEVPMMEHGNEVTPITVAGADHLLRCLPKTTCMKKFVDVNEKL